VVRIDMDMDDALAATESGHAQLLTYYQNLTGQRGLILKIFAILILCAFVFIVVGR
jgi:hypothetical protein